MVRWARRITEHEPWCVRDHDQGSCSNRRGHWARESLTWETGITQNDRELIDWALDKWKNELWSMSFVMDHVRANSDTLQKASDQALQAWWMTRQKAEKEGKTWPI